MSRTQRVQAWLWRHDDLFIDLVRVYLGCGLFVKAVFFMFHREQLIQMITEAGTAWIAPALVAHYVIVAHFAGGTMLALGLATRIAALIQVPALLGAVFSLYLPRFATVEPRQHLEYAGLVLFLLMLFSVFGAGRFSFDYLLQRRWQRMRRAEDGALPTPVANGRRNSAAHGEA